jgi:hypothetical protein
MEGSALERGWVPQEMSDELDWRQARNLRVDVDGNERRHVASIGVTLIARHASSARDAGEPHHGTNASRWVSASSSVNGRESSSNTNLPFLRRGYRFCVAGIAQARTGEVAQNADYRYFRSE